MYNLSPCHRRGIAFHSCYETPPLNADQIYGEVPGGISTVALKNAKYVISKVYVMLTSHWKAG